MEERRGKLRNGEGQRVDADTSSSAKGAASKRRPRTTKKTEARLDALRKQIATGAYEIDFDQLAARLLAAQALDEP